MNKTVAGMKAQVLVETGRHTSTDRGRDTWEHTSKGGGEEVVDTLADKLVLTLSEILSDVRA